MKTDIENRLVVEIAKGLRAVKVNYNTSPVADTFEWASKIEEWIPEDLSRKCIRFCGGRGFRTFLSNEVKRKLLAARKFDSEAKTKSLTSFAEFRDTASVAQDIVTVLAGLPYRYRVTVGLPLSVSSGFKLSSGGFGLNKNIKICRSEDLPDPFPLSSENETFNSTIWDDFWDDDGYDTEVKEERAYFTSTTIGYSGAAGTSILARELEDGLRAFYGAGLALNIFAYQYIKEDTEAVIIIHREDAVDRPIITVKELESDLWSHKTSLGTKKLSGEESSSIDEALALKRISQVFRDDTFPKRLFTACIWYFRANFSNRPLDQLLEATIAIEVILGDRDAADGVGLTKLLGNRCAYMLGRTSKEREDIQRTFVELYKLRSSIVHSGKHRADQEEARIVNDATKLCGRLIAHELKALEREAR